MRDTVRRWIEAKRGAVGEPFAARNGAAPSAVIYKIMGKMFAILSLRGDEYVILKCEPELVPILRARYSGVGYRSHLDRRYWISIALDDDVPSKEIKRLISLSYDLVSAKLTGKRKAELAGSSKKADAGSPRARQSRDQRRSPERA